MLTIMIKLNKVDYEKLAQRFLPAKPFTKGLMKLIPNQVTNSLGYHLVLRNQERFLPMINQALEKALRGVQVATLRFMDTEREVYDMLKLELELKEIDYNSVLTQLLPKLIEGMSSQPGKTGQLGNLLLNLGEKPDRMLSAAFELLSQEEKDDLLVQLFRIYREDILQSLNHMAEQQKIAAEAVEIRLERSK